MVSAAILPDHGTLTFHLPIDELSFITFDIRLIAIFGVLEPSFTVSDAVQVLSYVPIPIKVCVFPFSVLLSPVEVPSVLSAISKSQSALTLKEIVHPIPIVFSEPI